MHKSLINKFWPDMIQSPRVAPLEVFLSLSFSKVSLVRCFLSRDLQVLALLRCSNISSKFSGRLWILHTVISMPTIYYRRCKKSKKFIVVNFRYLEADTIVNTGVILKFQKSLGTITEECSKMMHWLTKPKLKLQCIMQQHNGMRSAHMKGHLSSVSAPCEA